MKQEMCLQSVEKLSLTQMLTRLQALTGFVPLPAVAKATSKEISVRGDKVTALYRYRQVLLEPQAVCHIAIRLEEGVVIAPTGITQQCDLHLTYGPKSKEELRRVLALLLPLAPFILVEPDIYERFKQNQGVFAAQCLPAYGAGNIHAGLLCHLPWQIYLVNQGWADFLHKPLERLTIRQLRVKIRRLRSCLTFFKPALRRSEVAAWQNVLRRQGEELSLLRELDVALMAIERLKTVAEKNAQSYPDRLEELLRTARLQEALRLRKVTALSTLTASYAELVVWLSCQPLAPAFGGVMLQPYLHTRIGQWCQNIMNLTDKYPDFTNMPEMHKMRIKVKRFRYVLMSLPEFNQATGGNMLRRLKRLQDMLGFLHDEYINEQLVAKLTQEQKGSLQYEVALFNGWERAKVAAAIEALPDLWQDFCTELKSWEKAWSKNK
ncbi:MAG: CHAD domain-containing protein [Acidaminococcaceae bacterium]